MTAEEIRQRGIDAVRALEGREVFPLIGELLQFRDSINATLAAICEAEGIGPYADALYGIGMEMIRRRELIATLEQDAKRWQSLKQLARAHAHALAGRDGDGVNLVEVEGWQDDDDGDNTVVRIAGRPEGRTLRSWRIHEGKTLDEAIDAAADEDSDGAI